MIFNSGLQNNIGYTRTETLSESTKIAYGLDSSGIPDNAFSALIAYSLHGKYQFNLTIIIDNMPLTNAKVSGLTTLSGDPVYTNDTGLVIGFAEKTTTITFPYADLTEFSFDIEATGMITTKTLTGTRTIELLTLNKSAVLAFSDHVDTVSLCCIGGGGNGCSGGYRSDKVTIGGRGGGGGAGGYVSNLLNFHPTLNNEYIFIVGANGGGNTTITLNGVSILTAVGGENGKQSSENASSVAAKGNGNGGQGGSSGTAGSPGTIYIFNDESYGLAGGGGGGGCYGTDGGGNGGAPYGGAGGRVRWTSDYPTGNHGVAATGYGGGGGGGNYTSYFHYTRGTGASGYQGAIMIRFDKYKEVSA